MAFKRKSWADRIDAAEQRGKFSRYEIGLANDKWTTCAVGEVTGLIQWGVHVLVWDSSRTGFSRLGYLGMGFGRVVAKHKFRLARKVLGLIEEEYRRAQSL